MKFEHAIEVAEVTLHCPHISTHLTSPIELGGVFWAKDGTLSSGQINQN